MRKKEHLLGASIALIFAMQAHAQTPADNDPFLWLEDVEGEQALAWVTEENKRTLKTLQSDPRYSANFDDAMADLSRNAELPQITIIGDHVYQLFANQEHLRGLWRRMPQVDYLAGKTEWEPVIDVDALADEDGESWVFRGANCVKPAQDRCMITLSPGGSDASVFREYDLAKKTWVEDGFYLPEMKSNVVWADRDSLLVSAATGPEDTTTSGYGRVVRLWQRGSEFSEATEVMSVPAEHTFLWPQSIRDGDETHLLLADHVSIFDPRMSLLTPSGDVVNLGFPAQFVFMTVFDGQAVGSLQSDWKQGDSEFAQGSLISFPLDELGQLALPNASLLLRPTKRQAINTLLNSGLYTTGERLYFTMMEDVRGRLISADYVDGGWSVKQEAFPDNGVIRVVTAGKDRLIVTYENLLTPPTQYAVTAQGNTRSIASLKPRMDTSGLMVEQHFAVSHDGTKVPYFIARPKGWTDDNPIPTLVAAYGGFGVSTEPGYLGGYWGGHFSKTMLSNGGAFVLANIRGGAEYGPVWHQQGMLQNRQRVYDDFHAVAEDLIARGYTTKKQLGIYGASNSGLLMGVAYTQRPDLYSAVLCGVPLLDMRRYHLLLAGASWVGEYGNPDDPEMWEAIQRYSPYHNLFEDKEYPEVFFFTSTKDDRVHPGHARKMAAKMQAQEHPFLYFENTEGGHGSAADVSQKARLGALQAVYLMQELDFGLQNPD